MIIVRDLVHRCALIGPLNDKLMVLGLVQLLLQVTIAHDDHLLNAQVKQIARTDAFLFRISNLVLNNEFDDLALLLGHRPQDVLDASFLVVVLDRKQLRLIRILLFVWQVSVHALEVEPKLVELLPVPEAIRIHVVH